MFYPFKFTVHNQNEFMISSYSLRATDRMKLQNIPIALSLLHEKEYNNLYATFKKNTTGKKRAYSEKNRATTPVSVLPNKVIKE